MQGTLGMRLTRVPIEKVQPLSGTSQRAFCMQDGLDQGEETEDTSPSGLTPL